MIKFTTNQSLIDDHIIKDGYDNLEEGDEEIVQDEVRVVDNQKVKLDPLADFNNLAMSKLKAFADDNSNVSQIIEFVFLRVENMV